MLFNPGLKNGQVVTHSQLANLFQVKALKKHAFYQRKNTLVIISDYTKGNYPDKWIGDTLHLTGVGLVGDQKITGSTNAKLADSRTNGANIHLFQVMNAGQYIYRGRVRLVGDPYTETQPDKNGVDRLVWVFPIKPDQPDQVTKPHGLVFNDKEDYQNRGKQAFRDYIRRRDNYVGYRVQHITHGSGVVDSFNGTILTFTFNNNQTKTYNFDRSIKGGYLQFLD